jgi:hypothetical protein
MAQPRHSRGSDDQGREVPAARTRSRSKIVKPGRLPISEFAFDRAGAASPFGDDLTFPFPAERLTYEHPHPE